jgi:hypothetical protein
MHTLSLSRPRHTPWVTIIVHDTPKPANWLDSLDILIEAASSPAARDRTEIIFEAREPLRPLHARPSRTEVS